MRESPFKVSFDALLLLSFVPSVAAHSAARMPPEKPAVNRPRTAWVKQERIRRKEPCAPAASSVGYVALNLSQTHLRAFGSRYILTQPVDFVISWLAFLVLMFPTGLFLIFAACFFGWARRICPTSALATAATRTPLPQPPGASRTAEARGASRAGRTTTRSLGCGC